MPFVGENSYPICVSFKSALNCDTIQSPSPYKKVKLALDKNVNLNSWRGAVNELKILSKITITSEGPKVAGPDNTMDRLHFRQGDLDGACGLYCLVMALMLKTDKLSRDSIESLSQTNDGRTYAGKGRS